MPTQRAVSIKDVARRAGVSIGTVSNVLNRPDLVSDARRRTVERAIRDLGYVRNDAARQLKAGRSRAIGVIVLDASNPFYASLASGAESAGAAAHLAVLVGNASNLRTREEMYLGLFEEQRVRGVLLASRGESVEEVRAVRRRGTPIVLVDEPAAPDTYCSVSADDVAGGRLAVEHLLETGRRRIAFVGAVFGLHQVQGRLDGARAAVAAAGDASLEVIEAEDLTVLAGRAAGAGIAERSPQERPDAVFCANDILAVGVLQAFAFGGQIAVPDDIALIGYDDIEFTRSTVVPLSSISQPAELIGRTGLELLETEIAEGEEHRHRHVTFRPELVVRESTAPRR